MMQFNKIYSDVCFGGVSERGISKSRYRAESWRRPTWAFIALGFVAYATGSSALGHFGVSRVYIRAFRSLSSGF